MIVILASVMVIWGHCVVTWGILTIFMEIYVVCFCFFQHYMCPSPSATLYITLFLPPSPYTTHSHSSIPLPILFHRLLQTSIPSPPFFHYILFFYENHYYPDGSMGCDFIERYQMLGVVIVWSLRILLGTGSAACTVGYSVACSFLLQTHVWG